MGGDRDIEGLHLARVLRVQDTLGKPSRMLAAVNLAVGLQANRSKRPPLDDF